MFLRSGCEVAIGSTSPTFILFVYTQVKRGSFENSTTRGQCGIFSLMSEVKPSASFVGKGSQFSKNTIWSDILHPGHWSELSPAYCSELLEETRAKTSHQLVEQLKEQQNIILLNNNGNKSKFFCAYNIAKENRAFEVSEFLKKCVHEEVTIVFSGIKMEFENISISGRTTTLSVEDIEHDSLKHLIYKYERSHWYYHVVDICSKGWPMVAHQQHKAMYSKYKRMIHVDHALFTFTCHRQRCRECRHVRWGELRGEHEAGHQLHDYWYWRTLKPITKTLRTKQMSGDWAWEKLLSEFVNSERK